jgi:microsomal dipeptidase-like Zn-dependent dipeptidase
MTNYPCADLHCDLLSYLQEAPHANPMINGRIGCTIPDLLSGNVKFQVMAIYTASEPGSVALAKGQANIFKNLVQHYHQYVSLFETYKNVVEFKNNNSIKIITAIENAAGICEENDKIENAFENLNILISISGKPLYLGLTHHGENRFGGGNSTNIGLKEDGKALIDYLSQLNIAIDFSHTSDFLANDILNYISKNNIKIPVIASHSNFRSVYDHPRNLPDDVAKEIIQRNGLIGINLLRAFLNPNDENALYHHIQHGIELGGEKSLCLGADYFYCDSHPDQTRVPFFFEQHSNASYYPSILFNIQNKTNKNIALNMAYNNIKDYLFKNY